MNNWKVTYRGYEDEEELLREALCTLGNGYFATRGAAEETRAGDFHYPGTYLAGGYNRLETEISGRVIENEDLVNWPNWLVLTFRPEGGEWFHIGKVNIYHFEQELDLKEGILVRRIHFEDDHRRETELVSRRIVSMADPHLGAIQWQLTPKNWSGTVHIHSELDGDVTNNGVARYRELNGRHLEVLRSGQFEEEGIYLKARTRQSEITMVQAARTHLKTSVPDRPIQRETVEKEHRIAQRLTTEVTENKPLLVEKIVALYTSRDRAIADPLLEARKKAMRAADFQAIRRAHSYRWQEIWERADIGLSVKGERDQPILRLHIFHLFQTCSFHSIDLDIGVPARGWHGEAYRGHIFWDELFIFPFLNTSMPELARSLLLYRYRRLPEARLAAEEAGYEGAMFPWQSGSNGREESQVLHLNPKSGRWIPDNTHLQRHVNAAIVYNIWQYYQVTHDLEFLYSYGGEIILEVARYWASRVTYNEQRRRYELHGVVGPDEYHTAYPDAERPGLDNNAYTNVMAAWCLVRALDVIDLLENGRKHQLMTCLDMDEEDIRSWEHISRRMYVPFLEDGKIINQFEGFEKLEELDWDHYHEQYGEVLRLDRILEKEGDSVNRYRAVKQADVLMLFYLFSSEELTRLLNDHMGYAFDSKHIPDNIEYYRRITAHGSTLSKLIFSWVLARCHRDASWHNFKKALVSDFEDIQGGTTHEGIHLGAMAGTIDLIQRCYSGLEYREDALWLHPQLPEQVECISFSLQYRSHWLDVYLTREALRLKSEGGKEEHITVIVDGESYEFEKGKEKTFAINHAGVVDGEKN